MSERRQTFEEWSRTWDAIFNLCVQGKMSCEKLLLHTLRYRDDWNTGL